ncbi:MAG TPA: quinolinate synthase NadA [bacterium]|nr:quinolinate synthase NadA [bacterium]HOL48830.1 quinolinate synthase NadA [bacterium]HPQ18953.1 quinolinate synthase NadA [bacterium]
MEHYFITHCCKNKREDAEDLPAIKRYLGSYIEKVYHIAQKLNEGFLIFSGKFGFLGANDLIPYYDKLLSYEDFDELLKKCNEQYKNYNFKKMTFMPIDPKLDPKVKVYIDFIKKFAEQNNIELRIIPLHPEKLSIPKTIENKYLIKNIRQIKKEKKIFIASHIYQKPNILKISDFIGGPYEIVKEIQRNDYQTILICGVSYIAELAYIFNPKKIILQPRLDTICRFNNIMNERDILNIKTIFQDCFIIAHITTSLKVKLMADLIADEKHLKEYLKDHKIKKNTIILLGGNYWAEILNELKGEKIIYSEGECLATHKFTENVINNYLQTKNINRAKIKILVTPQCHYSTFRHADEILNPFDIYNYIKDSDNNEFLVCAEINLIEKLKNDFPDKIIHTPLTNAICNDMHRMRLRNIYESLINLNHRVRIQDEVCEIIRKKVVGLKYGN